LPPPVAAQQDKEADAVAESRWRIRYYCAISVVGVLGLHGGRGVHIFWILGVNYFLSECCATPEIGKLGVVLTWVFACWITLRNEWNHGYKYINTFHQFPIINDFMRWLNYNVLEIVPW